MGGPVSTWGAHKLEQFLFKSDMLFFKMGYQPFSNMGGAPF